MILYLSNKYLKRRLYVLEIRRVKEVLNAYNEIEVFYNNASVWIENIDEKNQVASVRNLKNNEVIKVPVADLVEENRLH